MAGTRLAMTMGERGGAGRHTYHLRLTYSRSTALVRMFFWISFVPP